MSDKPISAAHAKRLKTQIAKYDELLGRWREDIKVKDKTIAEMDEVSAILDRDLTQLRKDHEVLKNANNHNLQKLGELVDQNAELLKRHEELLQTIINISKGLTR